MKKTPSSEMIGHLRDYFLVFGTVGHYIKRVNEFHASRKTSEPLPPRWLHLAERSLVRMPYPKYLAFITATDSAKKADFEPHQLAKLDQLVDQINELLNKPEILTLLRQDGSPEFGDLSRIYKDLQHTVYGVKPGA